MKQEKSIQYDSYIFTNMEFILVFLQGMLHIILVSYLFYRSIWAVVIVSPYLIFYFKFKRKVYQEKQFHELRLQFKEGIVALAAALNAGYSLENAFISALRDIKLLYPNKESLIEKEFTYITKKNHMNVPIENSLMDFANRSGVLEIRDFANVVWIAKKSGGDLVKIIYKTAEKLVQKIEVNQEIESSLAAKKLEQKIMLVMPFAIILYIQWTNPNYMDCLYHNIIGICFMSVCLIGILIANVWAEKIINIGV